ncbi:hypothetical protein HW272_03115 [Peptostreptococcaceae bacterium oral taxon 081]|jgi:hypothetical protein|uniref:hypothetical protein n=1 Tax=Peptoanaerobacter stomatis TaxID=796937 RepID=UPI0005529AEF|nr:hypothetical protein [Peptoanaerobacter stomatis]NWO24676.1 hypothetical protein [Peptostreptococcaceae bacterium oral taxon 081]
MDNYRKQLALLYFKTSGNEYDLSELMKLLGLRNNQLDLILLELKNDGFICTNNYEIKITEKGILHLVSNNITNNADSSLQYLFKNIVVENIMALNEPYVPKKFLTKI